MPLQQSQKKRNSILILSTVTALCFLAIYTLNRPQSIDAIATDYFPETADQRLLKWGMTLPEVIEHNLADINEPFAENETLLFFHIPKSGGTTVKQYYGVYMHLETASQNGIQVNKGITRKLRKTSLICCTVRSKLRRHRHIIT